MTGTSRLIEVSQLNYTYPRTSTPAVRGMDFSIAPGEIFGFLGPSGAGKSTTQKILIGLLRDYQGQVQVFGKDLRTWQSDYYERIGVSPETPNHFLKLSAYENLEYFSRLYGRAVYTPHQLLEMVGLQEDGKMLVSQYSKGMKNRLTVARSLLHDPELLFFDEPTSGLDPLNARRIKDVILTQKLAGKTIFLTTHNMTVAEELCDRVAFIVDGKIVLVDSPRTLKLQHGKPVVKVEYKNNGHAGFQEFPLDTLGRDETFQKLLQLGGIQTIHS
jgi:fluoroquinolone transport system ATP-binding protein